MRRLFPTPPSPERAPGITRTALLQSAVTFLYTLLVAIAANRPASLGGQLLAEWLVVIDGLLEALLGVPAMSKAPPADGIIIYRHVLIISLAVTAMGVLATRRYWGAWAASIAKRFGPSSERSEKAERMFLIGRRLAFLGLFATAFLLFITEQRIAEAGWPLSTQSWMLFFAPGLTSVGYWFACYATALRNDSEA